MRPVLADHAHEARKRVIDALETCGRVSVREAAGLVLSSAAVPEALARSVVGSLFDGDARVRIIDDGWLELLEAPAEEILLDLDYVVLDVETTGGRAPADRITELGAVRLSRGEIAGEFVALINPEREIPLDIIRTTGITNEMVADKPTALQVMPSFAEWLGDSIVVAHNAWFDRSFVDHAWLEVFGEPTPNTWLCSVKISRKVYAHLKSRSLGPLCEALGISYGTLHRAGEDARATAQMFRRMLDDLAAQGVRTMDDLLKMTKPVPYKPGTGSRHTVGGWRKEELSWEYPPSAEDGGEVA